MNKDELKNKKLFLLDMDGTIYLDNNLFDYSYEFLNEIITGSTP
jgi:ribonucleotide monophosphatase NagD (HAD superfamily)